MSIGDEIAYRRKGRGKDATGSLVFDAERKQAQQRAEDEAVERPRRGQTEQIG